MRRKLFTALSAVSLLLCVAIVVLWIMGTHSEQSLQFDHDGQRWEAFSRSGALGLDNGPELQQQLDQRTLEVAKLFDAESVRSHFAGELEVYLRKHPTGDQAEASPEVKEWRDKRDEAATRVFRLKNSLASKPFPRLLSFEIKDWWLVAGSSILPVAWLLRRKRRMRSAKPGQCASCQYSLTGNTSGICPECGTAVARKAGT